MYSPNGDSPNNSILFLHFRLETLDLGVDDPTIGSHDMLITVAMDPGSFWCRLDDCSYFYYQDRLQTVCADATLQMEDLATGVNAHLQVQ